VSEPLFTPEERRRLDRLRVGRRRPRTSGETGEWRSGRLGSGIQFADHRGYVPGDDLRYVDWNVYARLGELMVKRFEVEESVDLLLLVDRSLSMAGPKALAARRVAAALGYMALAHLERVRLAWLPPLPGAPITTYAGRGRAQVLLDDLAAVPAEGATDHAEAVTRALGAVRRGGVAVLVSDFYEPKSAVAGLERLCQRGLEVVALQVLDPADCTFPLGEALRCVDSETGQETRVDVTPAFLDRLRRAWQRRVESLERWCAAREVLHLRVEAHRSLWEVVRAMLGRGVAVGGAK
jgi:uncharacterized protein (DUF58 family)